MGNAKTARFSIAVILIIAYTMLAHGVVGAQTPTPTPTSFFVTDPEIPPTPDYTNPTPTAPNFTDDPDYQSPPTPIPNVSFPDLPILPGPGAGLATPNLPDNALPTPGATVASIDTSFVLSYTAPVSISISDTSAMSNATNAIIDGVIGAQSVVSDVLSNTNALSATYMSLWTQTDEWAIESAPDWYAPTLPRPMADIGWRFELMGEDIRRRYTLTAWGALGAEVVALPIRFLKSLRELGGLLGPFGLFLTWLLIMLPVVMFFKFLEFIKGLAFSLWNFFVKIAHLIMDLIELIPGE